jgi:hypothetical protein
MGGREREGVEEVRRLRLWGVRAHHSHRVRFTKTGWCLCLRGIVACQLRLTYLFNRSRAYAHRVSACWRGTSRDPGSGMRRAVAASGVGLRALAASSARSRGRGGVRCGGVSGRLMRAPCLQGRRAVSLTRGRPACAEWIARARRDRRREQQDAL